jgi:hypothetical protein
MTYCQRQQKGESEPKSRDLATYPKPHLQLTPTLTYLGILGLAATMMPGPRNSVHHSSSEMFTPQPRAFGSETTLCASLPGGVMAVSNTAWASEMAEAAAVAGIDESSTLTSIALEILLRNGTLQIFASRGIYAH